MENAGNWEPRKDLYPDGFRPISDLLHASGMKLLLWFEPERVAPGTPIALEHPEWLLEVPPDKAVTWADYGGHMSTEEWVAWESKRNQLNAGDRLFNLGDPDARRWMTDFLSQKIDEFGIDCLRWDSNIAQLEYWRHADPPDRQGMAEIRYVTGQYALWDELLARHPGLIIDNCASGGRRIDLESIGRSTPLWRTDYAVGHRDAAPTQCHTLGLLPWVPLNGTGGGYLRDTDRYGLRSVMCASLAAGLHGSGDAQQPLIPEDYPFAHAKALLEEYLRLREYFLGDFYPLTEYSLAEDAWMAYQLDRPEVGDGLVVVLKRAKSPFTQARLPLRTLPAEADYDVTNLDTEATLTATGAELAGEGLAVELAERPDSALFIYRAREGT
jgi:alpha-galactosidase